MLNPMSVALATLTLVTGVFFSSAASARTIYLNGIDISSARSQTLKGVNLRIDENGNLFVEAPHYRVNEEQTFTPLSSYLQRSGHPSHQAGGQLPKGVAEVGNAEKVAELPPSAPPEQVEQPASGQPVESDQLKLQNKPGDVNDGDGRMSTD